MNRPPADHTVGAELRTAIQVLASVAGLAGYVYLIGGIVSWVELGAARLPSDIATAFIAHGQLFEVGLRSIVFMALGFTLLCAVAYAAGSDRWGANASDWHDVISQRGIRPARALLRTAPLRQAPLPAEQITGLLPSPGFVGIFNSR